MLGPFVYIKEIMGHWSVSSIISHYRFVKAIYLYQYLRLVKYVKSWKPKDSMVYGCFREILFVAVFMLGHNRQESCHRNR